MTRRAEGTAPAPGAARRLQVNPRYFTVASGDRAGKAIYLTGSHIWNNFHDGPRCGAARQRAGLCHPRRASGADHPAADAHRGRLRGAAGALL
jgi:hypothetical protein